MCEVGLALASCAAKTPRVDAQPDTTKPVLVFGEHGQLARALCRSLLARGEVFRAVGSRHCDLAVDPEAAGAWVKGARAVVNASAFTAVDAAESQPAANRALNATAPAVMAAACAREGIPFVHVSTDYVFNAGQGVAIPPETKPRPLNAYGRAKLAGERAVKAAGGRSLTVRTSWVFDGTGRNFLTTMKDLSTRGIVSVVDDQIGRPTYAGDLAEALLDALQSGWAGTALAHYQGGGAPVSWAGFAEAVFAALRSGTRVERIPTSDYPTPAARPRWSVLDTSGFARSFGHSPLPWRDGLRLALEEAR